MDVDARGPLGMTPLMVAAVRGGGLDTGSDAEDEQTAHIISELVAQGAQLNAAMDKTGETSLHLAARYVGGLEQSNVFLVLPAWTLWKLVFLSRA